MLTDLFIDLWTQFNETLLPNREISSIDSVAEHQQLRKIFHRFCKYVVRQVCG